MRGHDAHRQIAHGDARDGVFVSAAWAVSAWRHLVELGRPLVLAVEIGPDTWWLPLAEHLGEVQLSGAPFGDHHDLTGPRGAGRAGAATAMVHALEGLAEEVRLHALAPGGALLAALHERRGWTVDSEPSPLIPSTRIVGPGATRRLRRIERLGPSQIEVCQLDDLDEPRVRAFADARRQVWRARGRECPPLERLPGFDAFLAESVAALARDARARLWQLCVADVVVAQDLHLGPPEMPLLYMRAYDPVWAALSPGRVLLEQTLHLLHSQGVDVLDSGRGDEPYKLAIGGDTSTVHNAARRRSHQMRR